MDVVVWLRSLGLGKYEAVFRENEIDETVLPNLTAEDLKENRSTGQRVVDRGAWLCAGQAALGGVPIATRERDRAAR